GQGILATRPRLRRTHDRSWSFLIAAGPHARSMDKSTQAASPERTTECTSLSRVRRGSGRVMSETSVSIDGVRTPLLEVSPPEASEVVVSIHGNPGSIRDWENLASGVAGFARALAIDIPGFGTADKPENFDYSVPSYAHHLGKLLAERGVRRAHLVMHDFDGPWGLAWAANNPQAVASVTCINTGVLSGYRWHYLARIWQTPILGELFMASTTKAGMRLLLRHGNPRGVPAEYFDHVYKTF